MFLASIAGYLVAVLFAFCGIVNLATFLSEPEAITNHSDFTTGLVQAAWPLAVAVAICLLTEIAGLLTRQSIMLSSLKQDETTEKQDAPKKQPKRPAPLPSTAYFDSSATPAPVAAPEPKPQVPTERRKAVPPPPTEEKKPEGLNFFRVD